MNPGFGVAPYSAVRLGCDGGAAAVLSKGLVNWLWLVTDEHKRLRREVLRGERVSRIAKTLPAVQGCNVNMQFGGATSRDLARQADQYGLSLALLHQDAKLLHRLPSFRTLALRLASEGGC